MNMLNNGDGGTENFCDQCGDRFFTGATSSSPPPLSPPFCSVDVDPHLAVCGAPDCGVSFSQCARCKEEYAGCCSAACQALAEERATATIAAPVMAPGLMGMRVEQRLSGNNGEQLAGLGVGTGSFASSVSGARAFQRKDSTAASVSVSASARASSPEEERSNRKGGTPSSPPSTPGGASNGNGAEVQGAGKGNKKRLERDDESLLESYASRHSEAESTCLAAVREDTTRYRIVCGTAVFFATYKNTVVVSTEHGC